jgi:hypothetical protein
MRYAIGEIVLVVIGILIALYINNWNEKRKEREKFDQILVEVEKELILNINEIRSEIDYYANMDALAFKVLVDTLTIDDYHGELRYNLLDAIYWYSDVTFIDDSFKKLSQLNNATIEQQTLYKKLSQSYNVHSSSILLSAKHTAEVVTKNRDELSKYTWFRNWASNNLDDNIILDYFLGDPEYFNAVTRYSEVTSNLTAFLERYDREAVKTYKELFNYLDCLELEHSDSLLFQKDPNDYQHYLGKYDWKWWSFKDVVVDDSVVVSMEKGKLMYTGYISNRPDTRLEIIPVNRNYFRTTGGIYHLVYNEEGEVDGIIYSTGINFQIKMKKVR